ncbi:MAG: hypothetical protein FJ029_02310 [Actinobacteria bacterium]|nr:hypothetical protein [Actinomycetota bacterium]
MTFQPPSSTSYADFLEVMAQQQVLAYAASTGYTVISGSESSSDPDDAARSEKLGVLFIEQIMSSTSMTVGEAFMKAKQCHAASKSSLDDYDRRVLSIYTLYGFPTYKRTTQDDDIAFVVRDPGYFFKESIVRQLSERIITKLELKISK